VEAAGLAGAIGVNVVRAQSISVRRRRPATLFGSGAVENMARQIEKEKIQLVVVDAAVTPVQQRNLENAWRAKVIDRTALILEIFGERARTREGRLQVELAHLTYQRSRLVRTWTHLERQRGGLSFVGGPGETQLEIDRRLIDQRIIRLKRSLDTVKRRRALHRKARRKVPFPVVALVGYTNAGKSTLFNRLTGSDVAAEDQLFATLDPTMRALSLKSGRKVILSDTVGFISDLPTDLVAAFRATLEEVTGADTIIHVRDISHPDTEAQKQDVHGVLKDLGLDSSVDSGLIEALNKIDKLDEESRSALFAKAKRAKTILVPVSAKTGEGCDALLSLLDGKLDDVRRVVEYDIPLEDGAAIAWLYQNGEVLNRRDGERKAHIRVSLDDADIARFERRAEAYST
jgi:GTP-binding protein HflX